MIITKFDEPVTAEEARHISLTNRDDSIDRYHLRDLMQMIKLEASFGHTRISTAHAPKCRSQFYSKNVQDALRSMGYSVIEKKAYEWDKEKQSFSTEIPKLDPLKREQFFLEVTWG